MSSPAKADVLIVDDEPNALKVLSAILADDGYNTIETKDVESAVKAIGKVNVDAVITDLKMPGKDGTQLFEFISENNLDIPTIFLTAYGTVDSAVSAMIRGAYYYFIKPPDYVKLKSILAKAIEQRRLKKELDLLKRKFGEKEGPELIGSAGDMLKIFDIIDTIKDSESSVLITGETGTGKELIAKALHFRSSRREKPFIPINCAAIPRELLEAEFFGYEKGAFTGAVSSRTGKFEEAAGGTVFLDEIGDLEMPLQAKLLRVLQEKEIERLGGNGKTTVKFRLISSTNCDLKKEVRNGNFREDLYYRINVVHIDSPPLRNRQEDIPLLAAAFVKEVCAREKKVLSISDQVLKIFDRYQWPGNVRQLKNIVERAVVLAKGNMITTRELPQEVLGGRKTEVGGPVGTLKEMEMLALKNALQECRGNKSKTARMLGISRKALYKRFKDYQLL